MGKYEVTILEHINTKVNVIADAVSRQHDPLPSVFPTERLKGASRTLVFIDRSFWTLPE